MKKLLSIVLIMLSVQVFAQTNPITGITISLPANPDANTANWGTGTSLLMISATAKSINGRINPAIEESRILLFIKRDGKKVCSAYTSSSAPQADFNTATKVWSGGNAASFLGKGCILPPGDYELSVQFFGNGAAGSVPLSDEKIKPFTIKGNDQQAYQPPQPISPANGASSNEADIKKPITFRWTPVVPRPQEPVTYRLQVWQLIQGQTGAQAMKSNQPIITKDVDNITQAIITNIVDGPYKPPLICNFIWNVQALNREGKPIGTKNGTSEISSFKFDISSNTATNTITGDGQEGSPGLTCQPPQLIMPLNGTSFTQADMAKPVKVQWSKTLCLNDKGNPIRDGEVTYWINAYQLRTGQTSRQAIDAKQLVFTKDVKNVTETVITNLVSGPCDPPMICDFVLTVQAVDADGKPLGPNNGTSNMSTFKFDISSTTGTTFPPKLVSPVNGAIIKAGELQHLFFMMDMKKMKNGACYLRVMQAFRNTG